jgi:hypothetical protein
MTKAMPTTGLLSVYDGQQYCGAIVSRGRQGFEGYDVDDKPLGVYPTQKEAMQALYAAKAAP